MTAHFSILKSLNFTSGVYKPGLVQNHHLIPSNLHLIKCLLVHLLSQSNAAVATDNGRDGEHFVVRMMNKAFSLTSDYLKVVSE